MIPPKYLKTLSFLLLFLLPAIVHAQDKGFKSIDELALPDFPDSLTGWHLSGLNTLNFSQTALNNWAAGGTGNMAILANINVNLNYKKKKLTFDNLLNLNYGMLKADGSETQKSDDRIELISNAGYQAFGNFFYTGLASFRTQFHATFKENQMVSNFMAPAFLQTALGLSYKKGEEIVVFLAPVAAKFTFVYEQRLADSGSYGVEPAVIDPVTYQVLTPGRNIRNEFGAYFLFTYKREIMKNVKLTTRLDLFNNYSDPVKDNRKNIDVNWETNIAMKVNKYITCSIITHLIYDQNTPIPIDAADPSRTGPRTQFKEVLALGLTYEF